MEMPAAEHVPSALDLKVYARSIVAAVLERLCVPFALIDSGGHVDYSSAPADALFEDGRHMAVSPEGVMVLHSAIASGDLQTYLAELRTGSLDVNLVLLATDDSPPLFATLNAFTPPSPPGFDPLPPHAAMFIREGRGDEGIAVARTRFGLTNVETSVLKAIIAGHTVAEIAANRGVSVHTARKQLNTLMAKIGVSRQSQLAGVVDEINGRGRVNDAAMAMQEANEAARLNGFR